MNNFKSLVSIGVVVISTATTFSLVQPANALLVKTFEFTNINSSVPEGLGEKVTGEITFNSLISGNVPDGNYTPDSFVITGIPGFMESTWNDELGFQTNINLIPVDTTVFNEVEFTNNQITGVNFWMVWEADGSNGGTDYVENEVVLINSNGQSLVQDFLTVDFENVYRHNAYDSSSRTPIQYSESSPDLGLREFIICRDFVV